MRCCKLLWQHQKHSESGPKSCILLQLIEATCVRNWLIVKTLEHEKFKEWYQVKGEKWFYLFLTWKKCIKTSKKHHPVHAKQFCEKYNFTLWNYCSNRHITPPPPPSSPPPPHASGHIFTLDWTLLFVIHLFFPKVAKVCNFGKLQTSAIV